MRLRGGTQIFKLLPRAVVLREVLQPCEDERIDAMAGGRRALGLLLDDGLQQLVDQRTPRP